MEWNGIPRGSLGDFLGPGLAWSVPWKMGQSNKTRSSCNSSMKFEDATCLGLHSAAWWPGFKLATC